MPGPSQSALSELFSMVREDCGPKVWSEGVELAREKAVLGLRQSASEASFKVELQHVRVSPEVSLFVDDGDWTCSCKEPEDPCAHVAAAVIAFKRAREKGEDLPTGSSAAHVVYRFEVRDKLLAFRRFLRDGSGNDAPFWGDLTAIAAGKKDGPRVATTDVDLQIDRAMAEANAPELPPAMMAAVIKLLRGRTDVFLDDDPIEIQIEPIGSVLRLERDEDTLKIRIKKDRRIIVEFENGAVVTAKGIHPSRRVHLEPDLLKYLSSDTVLAEDDIASFVAKDLPRLRKQLAIENEQATGLQRVQERPYLYFETWREGAVLTVRPLIAYGKPPVAFVRGEQFEALGKLVPTRQTDTERLLRDHFARDTGLELYRSYEYTGQSAVEFVSSMRHRYAFENKNIADFSVHGELIPSLSLEGEAVDLQFSYDGHRLNSDSVLKAWERGESLVSLASGGFAAIPQQWFEKFAGQVRHILAAQQAGASRIALASEVAELCEELNLDQPSWLEEVRAKIERLREDQSFEKPAGFSAHLRPYQVEGAGWLQRLERLGLGGLLCDDMGLGKTVQAIAALKMPALIVAPNSLLQNWQSELRSFRPDLSVSIYHGAQRQLRGSDVTLTTYHTLRQDIGDLAERGWQSAVFDESQMVKNPKSQITKAALQLRAHQKIALTGTPIENRLEDIWSQLSLVNPGYLGSLAFFKKNTLPAVRTGDPEAVARLQRKLRPFMLRRLKQDVAKDLPEKTEIINHVDMTEEQRALYDTMLNEVKRKLSSDEQSVSLILTSLLRLRQICAHGGLLEGQPNDIGLSGKLRWLVEKISELKASSNKALLFSQWTGLLDLLEPHLLDAGVSFLRLDGTTVDRQGVVDRFSGGNYDLLLMSLKAGGVGLNLTVADHVFLFDPWWNPATEAQAVDRAHRIGQTKPVFVHKMVAHDSIEERVLALQKKKAQLSDMFVGENMQESSLNRDELLSLVFET